jgi:two-component system OmpR family sensor kinase
MTAWYVAVLTICLAVFGTGIYAGLTRYLISESRASLRQEAHAIGESLLFDYDRRGPSYIVKEMSEDYAPEIKDRFIRVTLSDGTELYRSGTPRDSSFDPDQIPKTPNFDTAFRTAQTQHGRVLIESIWYRSPAGNQFFVENGMPEESIHRILRGLLLCMLLAFPVVVAGAALGGYWIMRRSLSRIDQITLQAQRITSRNLSERLPTVTSGDELERLSTALNHMIARLDGAFQHINRFSADASHELRTPLTIIRGELESLVRDKPSPEEMREVLGSSLEEVDRLAKIVEDLLAISRLDAGEIKLALIPVELGSLVASTVEQMQVMADEKSIRLKCEMTPNVWISGDPSRLKQVIVNLLDNAINYTDQHRKIKLRVTKTGGTAILEVADNGSGISPEDLPHVFERFYTSSRSRSRDHSGTGLGLPIVKAICTAHGGYISVKSQASIGTTIKVEFPLNRSEQNTRPLKATERALPKTEIDSTVHASEGKMKA